uniref:Uncharacterized protein n=1 Tax=Guillardia theta TaxID=55529 RepID=A0A7S4PG87_GUITH|mmetsp:Transcript_50342/g.157240  ORF Transcript_50342/g.157240 Transcript_50342/m.157240 type:complete len:258 (+) Transcript_50342:212-985(+)
MSPLTRPGSSSSQVARALSLAAMAFETIKKKFKMLQRRSWKSTEVYAAATAITALDVGIVSFLRLPSGNLLVESFPLITNSIQGAGLVFAGDLVSQAVVKHLQGTKEFLLDWTRLAKASLVGVINVGLWPYYWYLAVETFLPAQAPTGFGLPVWLGEWGLLLVKIVLDSIINGSFSIFSSFSLWSLMDRDTVEQWKDKFRNSFMETWLMDWKSWPLYNILCFTIIPFRLRPMTSGIASMFWNAYVSHQSQRVNAHKE